jgi:hypothetical protein
LTKRQEDNFEKKGRKIILKKRQEDNFEKKQEDNFDRKAGR